MLRMEFFALIPISFLSPLLQILLIAALFILLTLYQFQQVQKTGKMFSIYPPSVSILFAPLYEEVIFRGFVLWGLLSLYSVPIAILITSLLFGLWHLKNIFWDTRAGLTRQILYATLIIGPLLAILTVWSGSIWLAVIVHYLNNLWSPISKELFRDAITKQT